MIEGTETESKRIVKTQGMVKQADEGRHYRKVGKQVMKELTLTLI